MKLKIKGLFVLALSIFNAAQSQGITNNAIPNWVKLHELPSDSNVSKYDIKSGFYLKLLDYQVNLEENAHYFHEVRNVISYGGITKASQLMVTYDTSYQHLQIHHLFIWRKGQKIDCTNKLSWEIMNNEYNLQNGIYNGAITAYDNLDDIRKNDLIDFAYTLVGNNPIFGDDKYLFVPLEEINPIDLFSVRVIYPQEKEYQYKLVGCDSLNAVDKVVNNYRQIEITFPNLKPLVLEENIPSWSIPYKYLELSSYKSWTAVNKWAQTVFSLSKKPALDEVYKEIFNGDESTDQKISKLIDFVQDDIRYMGIESGIGSIKPFSPEQVVKQRFGDCKDKSLLLVWLLKNIGINNAYPVLVNTALQNNLGTNLVSNQIFNHCIVMFEHNNKNIWVDPTIAMQGGNFMDNETINYGKALVVGKPADSLQVMDGINMDGETKYDEAYVFKSFTEPGHLKITSERSGIEANTRRFVMAYYSAQDIEEALSNDLKKQFSFVNKTSDVKINDDLKANKFIMTYDYDIGGMWKDGSNTNPSVKDFWLFRFEPQTIYPYLNLSVCEERNYDFALAYPQNVQYSILFNFPKDLLITDDFMTYDNEVLHFEEKVEQLNSHSVRIDYHFKTKANCIKAASFKNVCQQMDQIVKNLPIVFYFPK